MCGGGGGKDDSAYYDYLAQQEDRQASEKERERQAQEDAKKASELAQLRSAAASSARSQATRYFESQGVSADDYQDEIDQYVNEVLSTIASDETNPASYFSSAGQTVFEQEQTAERNRYMKALDRLFGTNYAETRVESTLDDPYLASIYEEQYQSADDIIRNMLERGVITDAGYSTAQQDLDRQGARVRSKLNEVGTGQLESGRQSLRDIINNARSTASNVTLGSTFDPYSYSGKVDQSYSEFLANLPDNIRAALGGSNLFETSGLAAKAGAGQGAQNTKFNAAALAGNTNSDDDEDKDTASNATVF